MEKEQLDNERQFFERQLVVFRIAREEFGVDINDVREIIKMGDVTKIPNTEEYILGVINLRGKIIVIIDFAKKLELQRKEKDKNTRVIITEVEGNTVGMVVDSCNEVMRITGDKIEPAPPTITQKIDSDYIQGVGIIGERLLILLDIGKIIKGKDIEHINKAKDLHAKDSGKSGDTKKKILIVDDSSMMRGTLKSYINAKEYDISEAKDGEEAISKAKNEKPNLILLDIKMPKVNGIDALKKIKEMLPETVVVMETSVYEEETKKQCLDLGAKEYLKKPISKKQIEDVLKATLK